MNEHEQRQWAAHLDATLPPPVPPADRLYERTQAALAMLQELEVELGNSRPDLVAYGQQVTDAVSMVGRLTDLLDYEQSHQAEEEEPEEGHGWRMEP